MFTLNFVSVCGITAWYNLPSKISIWFATEGILLPYINTVTPLLEFILYKATVCLSSKS